MLEGPRLQRPVSASQLQSPRRIQMRDGQHLEPFAFVIHGKAEETCFKFWLACECVTSAGWHERTRQRAVPLEECRARSAPAAAE
jgi:hypothetical protein